MRFLVMVKGGQDYEEGRLPTEEEIAAMTQYNEELAKAGVMLAGEGLHPTTKGAARVTFTKKDPVVTDGPFAEAKELIAGYWVWETKSLEEAIEWLKKAPFEEGAEVDIRQIHSAEDLAEAFTPELQEREQRVAEMAKKNANRA